MMEMKNDINKANDTIQTKSMGRPKKPLDEDVIANLSQIGCTQEELDAVQYPGYNNLSKYMKKKEIKDIMERNNKMARIETWLKYPDLQEKIDLKELQKLEE